MQLRFWIALVWLGVGAVLTITSHNVLRKQPGGSGIGSLEFAVGILTWPIVLTAFFVAWLVEEAPPQNGDDL